MTVTEDATHLVTSLKRFDNEKGYKLSYKAVNKNLQEIKKQLIQIGEPALESLHELIKHEATWSSQLALGILKEIKSEKSIPHLIRFIRKNENGDYFESCDDALFALSAIGKPAVAPLLRGIKEDFEKKKYYAYLVGAVTEIKDDEVYKFMIETLAAYIADYKRYDDWLRIDNFTYNFTKQDKKEALPILEKLEDMKHLSHDERKEIKATTAAVREPGKMEKEVAEAIKSMNFKEFIQSFKNMARLLSGKGLSAKAAQKIREQSEETDDEFEANFRCKDCRERQNNKTGLIFDMDEDQYAFDKEIICRYCLSNNLELTERGKSEIVEKNMRIFMGKDKGVLYASPTTLVENKKMLFSESYKYILGRIQEEPENGELYLRAGNVARKNNDYNNAIKLYQKAIELDQNLIASYVNLVEIYMHRWRYYNRKEAEKEALEYFLLSLDIFNKNKYNMVTIRADEYLMHFFYESAKCLGMDISLRKIKIGRNDPCPCGSDKKYKKCCLKKDI